MSSMPLFASALAAQPSSPNEITSDSSTDPVTSSPKHSLATDLVCDDEALMLTPPPKANVARKRRGRDAGPTVSTVASNESPEETPSLSDSSGNVVKPQFNPFA